VIKAEIKEQPIDENKIELENTSEVPELIKKGGEPEFEIEKLLKSQL